MSYTVIQDGLDAAYLGADLVQLDAIDDKALADEVERRFDAAVKRGIDPHDDPAYLRAVMIRNGRDGFHAGRLVPLRIRPFAI